MSNIDDLRPLPLGCNREEFLALERIVEKATGSIVVSPMGCYAYHQSMFNRYIVVYVDGVYLATRYESKEIEFESTDVDSVVNFIGGAPPIQYVAGGWNGKLYLN